MQSRYWLTNQVLDRLGDLDNDIWSRDEVALFLQDGYDQFCRRTRCLFDIYVIENIPHPGNWQTHFERWMASQRSGWGVSDEPMNWTGGEGRNFGTSGKVGGSLQGPAQITHTSGGEYIENPIVYGGRLPDNVVRIFRVAYDEKTLVGLNSHQMRKLDPLYESRGAGDPQWFTFDKDGLMFVRLVPPASGNASYDTTDGVYGTMRQSDDSTLTAVGQHGILRYIEGDYNSGGKYGTMTRRHPIDSNVTIEVWRLGRNLNTHPTEIPDAYDKYVIYYAMGEALKRSGPGQDQEMSKHYLDRFEMGIGNMIEKRATIQRERVGRFGGVVEESNFGLGMPQPPTNWGTIR